MCLPAPDVLRDHQPAAARGQGHRQPRSPARPGTSGCGSRSGRRTRPRPGDRRQAVPSERRMPPPWRASSAGQPRALLAVAHRCPCGLPDVVETAPRLPDGTPFPTLYYLTCPRAVAAVSRLESGGLMREMTRRLAAEPRLRAAYRAAHRDYLARRDEAARAAGVEPLPPGTPSAGGMPDRVKCLHALVAHELAVPGSEPARAGRGRAGAPGAWWSGGPVRQAPPWQRRRDEPGRGAVPACAARRLRHQLAAAAHRRRGRGGRRAHRRGPADGDRPARPGRGRHRPARARAAGADAAGARGVRGARSGGPGPAGCGWSPPARPGTRPTPRSSSAGSPRSSASRPRCSAATRRPGCRSPGRRPSWPAPRAGRPTRPARRLAPPARPLPGRGHRRRVHRVRARLPRPDAAAGGRGVGRHRLRPDDRAAPALRPAAARPRSRRPPPTSTRRWTWSRRRSR